MLQMSVALHASHTDRYNSDVAIHRLIANHCKRPGLMDEEKKISDGPCDMQKGFGWKWCGTAATEKKRITEIISAS